MYNSYYEKILATGEVKCIDEEIPFEIPDSWEWVRYREIANCLLGKTKNPHQQSGTTCPYLCSINVYWDKIKLSDIKEMLFSDTDMKQYSVHKGDMLICEGGEAGRTAIYNGDIEPMYFQNALHRVRFYGNISARFYLHQMEFYKKTGMLNDHIKGETIQHFVLGKLQELIVPLPPLAEQQRIVEKLETLLPLVEQYSDAQIKLEKLNSEINGLLKKSILQEAIQGKLVAQCDTDEPATELLKRIHEEKLNLVKQGKLKRKDVSESTIFRSDDNRYYEKVGSVVNDITDEIPYELPNNWSFVRLSSICYLDDGTKASGEKLPYMDAKFHRGKGEIVYLTQGKIVEPPCKAILVDGENSGEIFNITERGYLGSTFKILQISSCIFEEWLHLLLDAYRDLFKNSKVGAAIPHLNKNLFRNLIIGLPPYEEQIRITKNVIKLQKSIEGL